jgi:hypothetical protein
MNYCEEQLEYLEWKAQHENEKQTHSCDIAYGRYMLVDDASPSESPMYFRSLHAATLYADGTYPFSQHHEWSVYRVGHKVL